MLFKEFPKIPRLSRECIITEKLDGTNASVLIEPMLDQHHFMWLNAVAKIDGFAIFAGSRTKWVTPDNDNYGFAKWVQRNAEELLKLGVGHHFGEWWGNGIQRKYDLPEKRFSLFNVHRWSDDAERPACCHVVPTLYTGMFTTYHVTNAVDDLRLSGSQAAPGFMKPEGVMIYHTAAKQYFKKTIEKDEKGKGE